MSSVWVVSWLPNPQVCGRAGRDVVCLSGRKEYPGLGNRLIFYPYSSVGNTLALNFVEDTGANLLSNVSTIETLVRASLKSYLPGSPGIETKRVD